MMAVLMGYPYLLDTSVFFNVYLSESTFVRLRLNNMPVPLIDYKLFIWK